LTKQSSSGIIKTTKEREVNNMKNIITSTLITLAVFGVALFFVVKIVTWEAKIDADTWNNGICYCGGEYEFSNASAQKNGGNYYFYHCDDCGYVIRTHQPQRKN
jgi:hypothetical protein